MFVLDILLEKVENLDVFDSGANAPSIQQNAILKYTFLEHGTFP